MAFNPTEFYEFSSWMNAHLPDDAVKQPVVRSIVSRAYYSALLNSSDFTSVITLGGHGNVINALKAKNQNTGNKLYALKLLRQKADYEREDVTKGDANKALRDARSILNFLHKQANLGEDGYLVLP